LTEIKIIGDAGQFDVKLMESQIKKYLRKFDLSPKEIYLVFIENAKQLRKVYQKFGNFKEWSPEELLLLAKIKISGLLTAYLTKRGRKKGIPPIILIKKGEIITEKHFLDEIAHMKEEEKGWLEVKEKALAQLANDYLSSLIYMKEVYAMLFAVSHNIVDFFSDEIKCQYGLTKEVFKKKWEDLKKWADLEERVEKFYLKLESIKPLNAISLNALKFFTATMELSLLPYHPVIFEKKMRKNLKKLSLRIFEKEE
jgi:hypothetical protein